MKAIELEIKGIQCDNSECDFTDDTVKVADYQQWLNKPCPKCGSNLLTEEDMEAVKMITEIANSINEIVGEVPSDEPRTMLGVGMDGSGDITIKKPNDQKLH